MWTTILDIAQNFWGVFTEMSPYLLLGFAAAGVLSIFISARLVERHLGGEGGFASFKAALFGIPLPLCSCGVIPVSASLRRQGAGKGATIAFLTSTPQTGVDSILVTYGLLGPVFAVFRPLVALICGVATGVMISLAAPDDYPQKPQASDHSNEDCGDSCEETSRQTPEPEPRGILGRTWAATRYGFETLPRDIGKALLVGLVISALITTFVPDDFFVGVLGGGIVAMLIMAVAGIPMYVCATASVPVAAALIARGASPGAALVFLMTGPATNAATITTIWKVMGRRTAVIYLLSVLAAALTSGWLLDTVYQAVEIRPGPAGMSMLPGWLRYSATAALLAVLAWSLLVAPLRDRLRRASEEPSDDQDRDSLTLDISGMTCSHCASSVQEALESCDTVESASVDLSAGKARVYGEDMQTGQLTHAVKELGYEAEIATTQTS